MDVDVKICGLTRPDDAALAVAHGASYLGVVFAGGPRMVDVAVAASIVAAGADVLVAGNTVFKSKDPSDTIAQLKKMDPL